MSKDREVHDSLDLDEKGVKHDKGKPRMSLVPLECLESVIRVLEFGAEEYSVDNWKTVPGARDRYYDAVHRHMNEWRKGVLIDPKSGEPHLSHAISSLLFLDWFDITETPYPE
jgi:hypothetical protein